MAAQTEDRVTPYEQATATLGTASRTPTAPDASVLALAGLGWALLAFTEELRFSVDRLVEQVRWDDEVAGS